MKKKFSVGDKVMAIESTDYKKGWVGTIVSIPAGFSVCYKVIFSSDPYKVLRTVHPDNIIHYTKLHRALA